LIIGENRLPFAAAEWTREIVIRQQSDDAPTSGACVIHLGDEISMPEIPILDDDAISCGLNDRRNLLCDYLVRSGTAHEKIDLICAHIRYCGISIWLTARPDIDGAIVSPMDRLS
jgi:hypothetical protein